MVFLYEKKSLMLDIVDNIGTKNLFTKLDLQ